MNNHRPVTLLCATLPLRVGSIASAHAAPPRATAAVPVFEQGRETLHRGNDELLTAGLGIVEALEALSEKEANPATHAVLGRLLAGLREGKRFSSVLAEQPELFPPL